jgi:hypothetical protein
MTDSDQWIFIKEGCQWIGMEQDPSRGPVTTCGNKVLPGKSYCAEHHALCFKKPKKNKPKPGFKLPAVKINF